MSEEMQSVTDQAGNLLAYKQDGVIRVYDGHYSELAIALLLDKLCALADHYPERPTT